MRDTVRVRDVKRMKDDGLLPGWRREGSAEVAECKAIGLRLWLSRYGSEIWPGYLERRASGEVSGRAGRIWRCESGREHGRMGGGRGGEREMVLLGRGRWQEVAWRGKGSLHAIRPYSPSVCVRQDAQTVTTSPG